MIPSDLSADFVLSDAPAELRASLLEQAKSSDLGILGIARASAILTADDATQLLRSWSNGKGDAYRWALAQRDAAAMSRATHSRTAIRQAHRACAALEPSAAQEYQQAADALASLTRHAPPPASPIPAPLGAW